MTACCFRALVVLAKASRAAIASARAAAASCRWRPAPGQRELCVGDGKLHRDLSDFQLKRGRRGRASRRRHRPSELCFAQPVERVGELVVRLAELAPAGSAARLGSRPRPPLSPQRVSVSTGCCARTPAGSPSGSSASVCDGAIGEGERLVGCPSSVIIHASALAVRATSGWFLPSSASLSASACSSNRRPDSKSRASPAVTP